MKVIIICIAFLTFFQSGIFGQLIPLGYDTLILHHEIIVEGGIDFASTAIQKDLSEKFLFGGYIPLILNIEITQRKYSKRKTVDTLLR